VGDIGFIVISAVENSNKSKKPERENQLRTQEHLGQQHRPH
jgi:hypothetical protein